MAILEFTKMHGCGNDYIYVIATAQRPADPAALSRRLSDRRFAIGGDGLILLGRAKDADVSMEIYNADGSRAEMCGNGIRCVARLAYERGLVRTNPVTIATDSGFKRVWLEFEGAVACTATVDMGAPILEGHLIPVAATGQIIAHPLSVDGTIWPITAVSMGNPHCVVLVEDERLFTLPEHEFAALGRRFEHHPFFPHAVNTEFVLIESPARLRMRVWERGSGETLACGTGACAAVVAVALNHRGGRQAQVALRGGTLGIEWRQSGPDADHVFMSGEAVKVFSGQVELEARELVALD
ncbi:MAG TPA: diaminopimelate epimerase [Candidatus Binataceae bacterium]|nr:diaminopimelate epimerase [Candidatus Binataceae bacterium]